MLFRSRAGLIPEKTMLFQNYPNPFNPVTMITYQLPKSGFVEIKIFDITGRLVRTLISEQQEFGSHQILWDSRNESGQTAASGLYFYQIRFENSFLSSKMLLLK